MNINTTVKEWIQGRYFGNFLIKRVVKIQELQNTLIELTHEPTGALFLHLANDDDENLFSLSFQTCPHTSNGVAHILEHTILCGSKKFPVSDPFFSMNRRSLNTYMNALTGADFTCYPAATQIPKDFYNLLEVYLDAVFHPLLLKKSFLQEGHRLEFQNPNNMDSPLEFKGIVFNEMKGALATGEARLGEALMENIFPDVTYGVNSGGDPKEIPKLTYEELKEFHAKYYHPSRCLFFFYGNLPLEGHLDLVERFALKGVKKAPPLPPIPFQPRFTKSVKKILYYPTLGDESDEKTLIGMGWLMVSIHQQEELLALNAIDLALMGTDASLLKIALLKSDLCKQVDSHIDNEMHEIPYFLIFRGCAKKSGLALEEIVRKTLFEIVQTGIPHHLIEGALHQLELSRYEITGNSIPYGLSLFFRSALLRQHGANPEDGLRIHTMFNHLMKKPPSYFTDLVSRYFLNNAHFVHLEMEPDPELAKKESQQEKNLLKTIKASLNKEDKESIVRESKELLEYQQERTQENLDVLPRVTLQDVPKHGKEYILSIEKCGPLKVFIHPCFTNDIAYAEIVFNLPNIEESDLPFLRLFAAFLPEMGCGGRNYIQNLDYILQHTGGINATLDLFPQADDPNQTKPGIAIRGKALYRKLDRLCPLFYDLITSVDFTDVERLKELLMQHFNALETSIRHSALRYAIHLAASGLSVPLKIINSWSGLDYYWKVKEVKEQFEINPDAFVQKMQKFQNDCLGLEGAHLVISCEERIYNQLKEARFYGLENIPQKKGTIWEPNYPLHSIQSQGRLIPSPVAFTAMLFRSVSYVNPYSAALNIASKLAENLVLHTRIREQGGAYGSGAVCNVLLGNFYFFSFRDPHVAETLKAFQEACGVLALGKFKESDIEEAKLGIFQDIDAPIPPGARAATAYARYRSGRTPERRQIFRNELFRQQKRDIQEAVINYLLPGLKEGVIVTFANKELLEKENARLNDKALQILSI